MLSTHISCISLYLDICISLYPSKEGGKPIAEVKQHINYIKIQHKQYYFKNLTMNYKGVNILYVCGNVLKLNRLKKKIKLFLAFRKL